MCLAIPGKVLVASVTAQSHRHVLSCGTRNIIGGNGGGIGKRLVVVPDQLLRYLRGPRLDDLLVVVCMELARHLPRVAGFVKFLLRKADGAGSHRLRL